MEKHELTPSYPMGLQQSSDDIHWINLQWKIIDESLSVIKGAANQLIGSVTVLQGLYFAVVSFSDLKTKFGPSIGWTYTLLFISPIIFWLITIGLALLVIAPWRFTAYVTSPSEAKNNYEALTKIKYLELKIAYFALFLGFLAIIIGIIVYVK